MIFHISVVSLNLQIVDSNRTDKLKTLLSSHWTVACQTPLSMEFSSQEYWS